MLWDHSKPFPLDPNAPLSPPDCAASVPPPASESPHLADRYADALERELAQMHLIGPAAGAELRCIVNGVARMTNVTDGASRSQTRRAQQAHQPI
jgi:hypothetical protein